MRKYNSPYEIGVSDLVTYRDETGYISEYHVLINYIKGETDKKGYTPKTNRTILVEMGQFAGRRTTCHDYTKLVCYD